MFEFLFVLLGRNRCPVCGVTTWRGRPARHHPGCARLVDDVVEEQVELALREEEGGR